VGFPVSSLTRAQAALIRALIQDKKVRVREGAFVLEGAKACFQCIVRHPESVISLTLSSRYLREEDETGRSLRAQLNVPQFSCTDDIFEKLSDVHSPQGILAMIRTPKWDDGHLWRQSNKILGIYGERIRDPANVGAIIRTAAGLDLSALWLSSDSADCFSPKVVRATAGTVLDFPVIYVKSCSGFTDHHCSIYSAVLPSSGTVSLRSIRKVPRRLVVAVGNEGQGLNPKTLEMSDVRFTIPLARGVESFNVSATVAISAFYMSGIQSEP
jgi:RNA methyltransferase, TrmH family